MAGRSPKARLRRRRAKSSMKSDEERLESIKNVADPEETITFETSPSRPINNKRVPKDISQSPQKNICGSPTRGLPVPHQLNRSYSLGQPRDRLERTRSKAKKAREEKIEQLSKNSSTLTNGVRKSRQKNWRKKQIYYA